jgi:hypothetical protein
MADRTSAGLFGYIFGMLAEEPTEKNKEIASKIFDKTGDYDFSYYQMYADEHCIKLGLAKMAVNPEYPEDGEVCIFKGESGWE